MKKTAQALAQEYEVGNEYFHYYDYIIDSLINGNRTQVKQLFNEMKPYDQKEFLINYLDLTIGYHKSVLNICIGELTE